MKTFGISHTRWERVNFYHRLLRTERKTMLNSLVRNSSISSKRSCFGFSQLRKISARISCWTHRITIDLLCPQKMYYLGWKPNTQSTSLCFGVVTSDGDVIPPFIFLHVLRLNMEAYIKCLEDLMLFWIERMAAGRPYISQDSAPCNKKQENPVLTLRKFLWPYHS